MPQSSATDPTGDLRNDQCTCLETIVRLDHSVMFEGMRP